jgi:hypothetical protein
MVLFLFLYEVKRLQLSTRIPVSYMGSVVIMIKRYVRCVFYGNIKKIFCICTIDYPVKSEARRLKKRICW